MRTQSLKALSTILCLTTVAFALLTEATAHAQTTCSSVAVFKYPDKKCTVTIDRRVPGSPLPVQVPAGTTVTIIVGGQRKTEILKTVTSNDAVAKPDIFGNAIKQVVSPLASIIVHAAPPRLPLVGGPTPLSARQDAMGDAIQTILDDVNEASQRVSCLQLYVVYDGTAGACTQTTIPSDAVYDTERQNAVDIIDLASKEALPYAELAVLDTDVGLAVSACPKPTHIPDPASDDCNKYQTNEKKLDSALAALQTAQNAVGAFGPTLDALQVPNPTTIPPMVNTSNIKATMVITAQEQIGKTSSPVATVIITWQQSNWSLSTGVVLSSLANQTFANSPQYSGGAPIIDSSGKTPTIVTGAQSYPGVISPIFMVNYRLHNFQRDQGRWAFLLSGGIGANLATKSADFAFGPSFQYGSMTFGPVLHYGRQTELINGVKVGDQLGDSPPALPTNTVLKPAFGISLCYRLPIT